METILFVHGTGVRAAAYERTLMLLREKARVHLPDHDIVGCNWGDAFGARLNARGASIPGYRDDGAAPAAIEAATMARWTLLADDPLLELRVVELPIPMGGSRGLIVLNKLLALGDSQVVLDLLSPWGVAMAWPEFIASLRGDPAWHATFKVLGGSDSLLSAPVARAVAAAFTAWLRAAAEPGLSGVQRDALVDQMQRSLGGPAMGLKDWFLERVTNYLVPRRSAMSDASGAPLGDILRYQARGDSLRNFIGERIAQTGARVILAHSLGGVAAVDWLAEAARDVAVLVTVGSQAPFFYEIDALTSRAYGTGLPEHFPRRWLNFHDPRDFLSYGAQQLFEGFACDVEVDNGQPFPESHSAYWQNDRQVWGEIKRFLR